MHLVYIDESGNTGNNLSDSMQPVFTLGALVVPISSWKKIESELAAVIEAYFPLPRQADFEIHMKNLRSGDGVFREMPMSKRFEFRDAWLDVAAATGLKFIHLTTVKKEYQLWMNRVFGMGVIVNPHVAAFPVVTHMVNDYLRQIHSTGILICDENKEIVKDIDHSISMLKTNQRVNTKLSEIIEHVFFLDSRKSLMLQLCDVAVFYARRGEEQAQSLATLKDHDQMGIKKVKAITVEMPIPSVWPHLEELLKGHYQKKKRPETS